MVKILINTPLITEPAGVANHFLGLKKYFSKNVSYNQIVTSYFLKKYFRFLILINILRPLFLLFNYIKFIILVFYYKKPNIVLNPSLQKNALIRDNFYLSIAKYLGCKVVVFIHGWNDSCYNEISKAKKNYFNFNKADLILVLSSDFVNKLKKIGVKTDIKLTTTKVDDKMLLYENENNNLNNKVFNILFLARLEKAKGIYFLLKVFNNLIEKGINVKLTIVGNGSEYSNLKKLLNKDLHKEIHLLGAKYGSDLALEYKNADCYILPTTHGEGMPTTVLEAMAFGLPVITRPVGGIVDFFNDKMGFIIDDLDIETYSQKISKLIHNQELCSKISSYNKDYAKKYFYASMVAPRLEKFFTI